MSQILTFLQGIDSPTDRYSIIGEEFVVCPQGTKDANQKLVEVFAEVNRCVLDGTGEACSKAWKKAKKRFHNASMKFQLCYNLIQRVLIKLWSWFTRQPTLESTFATFTENIVKSSDLWKQYPHGKSLEEKRDYLGQLQCDLEFFDEFIWFLTNEESPGSIVELICFYLNKVKGIGANDYLTQTGMLHEQARQGPDVARLLELSFSSLKSMNAYQQYKLSHWIPLTLLVYAIDNGNMSLAKYLEKHVNFEYDLLGRLLYRAVLADNIDLVKWLIRGNTQLNLTDKNGNTPLHIAASNHNYEIAKLLIKVGAVNGVKNNDGKTPADLANTPVMVTLFGQ